MIHLKDLRDLDLDTLLRAVGVQRMRSGTWVGPAVGGLAVGMLIGATVARFLTTEPGVRLREELQDRLDGSEESRPPSSPEASQVRSTSERDRV